ncbi:MAG: M20 family metallopeptidase [Atopobiaceae bacterium]|nr:M20 family metallopeptidase [Atopobiaceae bacterium]MCH4276405.1 M20 family metallopeptidase [Atopobiaceae bacterium]MCI1226492.1 M20 family metallopeptidase [Atopobiaceae bacterium]
MAREADGQGAASRPSDAAEGNAPMAGGAEPVGPSSVADDAAMLARLTADRRALHRAPEIGLDLPHTCAYVEGRLAGLGAVVEHPLPSCVTALFDVGAPATVAFRCDMDALPVTEATGRDFASATPGVMHACGHDGHTATMLELARQVSAARAAGGRLPHNVLLVFQPGEEHPGGARLVCETGLLERHHVGCVFGLHLWPDLAAGEVRTRPGAFLARASEMNVEVEGVSAHAAHQEAGVDALAPAARLALAIGEVAPAERSLGNPCVVNMGRMEAGTVRNAVAGSARIEGTVRTFEPASWERVRTKIGAIVAAEAETSQAKATVDFDEGYPAVINDQALTGRVLADVTGVGLEPEPSMIADDFSFYEQRVPGTYFFLGTGNPAHGLHSDGFDFDEHVLLAGVGLFRQLATMDWTAQMRVAGSVDAAGLDATPATPGAPVPTPHKEA